MRRIVSFLHITLICLAMTFNSNAQDRTTGLFMSPEEKAFMWHVVKKSPVLDRNIGMFFDYSGDTVYLETAWDYDSMASLITMEPTLLRIDYHALSNARAGLLLETVTKMALWKLHKALSTEEPEESDPEHELYFEILKEVTGRAPEAALRKRGGEQELKPDFIELLDPGMPMGEKIGLVQQTNLTPREQLYMLNAINDTYKSYIKKEGFRLFKLLGGHTGGFDNLLLAAGEGSGTAGLLGEVEKDENGNPDQKKPIGIGLFTYQLDLGKDDTGKDAVVIKTTPISTFEGFIGGDVTTLHMSIWGFNAFFQTTVVIKAEGKSYLLYGNKYSRELNPDSSFTKGKTYHRHIDKLKNEMIAELEEEIYGEDGLIVRVKRNEELEQQALEGVHESEEELKEYKLTNNRKKYKIAQQKYLTYSATYKNRKQRTKQSKIRLLEAKERLEYLNDKLYEMETNIGDSIVPWEKQDSLYHFADGSVFNAYTQDFRFGKTMGHRDFTVRCIAIGSRPLSKKVDEVQLYVNLTERPKEEVITMNLQLNDVFGPDEFTSADIDLKDKEKKFGQLIEYMVDREPRFIFDLKGHGYVGEEQLDNYPGRNEEQRQEARNSPEFKQHRRADVDIDVEGHIYINVDTYTDPVKSSIVVEDTVAQKIMMELHIPSGNHLLSGLRVFGILEAIQKQMLKSLEDYESSDFEKITAAHDRISALAREARVMIGEYALTWEHYQSLSN